MSRLEIWQFRYDLGSRGFKFYDGYTYQLTLWTNTIQVTLLDPNITVRQIFGQDEENIDFKSTLSAIQFIDTLI